MRRSRCQQIETLVPSAVILKGQRFIQAYNGPLSITSCERNEV